MLFIDYSRLCNKEHWTLSNILYFYQSVILTHSCHVSKLDGGKESSHFKFRAVGGNSKAFYSKQCNVPLVIKSFHLKNKYIWQIIIVILYVNFTIKQVEKKFNYLDSIIINNGKYDRNLKLIC